MVPNLIGTLTERDCLQNTLISRRVVTAAGDSQQLEANQPRGRWPLRSYRMAAISARQLSRLRKRTQDGGGRGGGEQGPVGEAQAACRCAVALPMRKTSPRPITRDMGVGRR